MEVPNYTLLNGVEIPCVGYGTAQEAGVSREAVIQAVEAAISLGYRHIDTAQMYENEREVGAAIRRSGVGRGALFLTTKLHNRVRGYEQTMRAYEESLCALGTDYADLFLIHWPNPVYFRGDWARANAESWRAMEALYRAGAVRAIGVSNFRPHHLDALLRTATVCPMVNQIRLFPGDAALHAPTIECCRRLRMVLEGYSPLGLGQALTQPVPVALAEKYGRTAAQVCLRWSVQKGYLPLPKTLSPARMAENLNIFSFHLEDCDMAALDFMPPSLPDDRDPDSAPW